MNPVAYFLCLALPIKGDADKRLYVFKEDMPTDERKIELVDDFIEELKRNEEDLEVFAIQDYQIMTSKGLYIIFTEEELEEASDFLIKDLHIRDPLD